jgi:membrane protease YdiL (CAAX protease family)
MTFNMQERINSKFLLVALPFLVLLLTKVVILLSIQYFPSEISWIPGFIGYYLSILLAVFISQKYLALPIRQMLSASFSPMPRFRLLLFTILIPALLPISVFITEIRNVPFDFCIYILIFACINPIFEETFWRGVLFYLPGNNAFRVLYSAALFGFSHFFLWGYWFKSPWILIPTVISTFIMGIAWMWFMNKQKNLIYPIISHIFVDIFNLSVAVYYGLVPVGHF